MAPATPDPRKLAARFGGFSLHAGTRVAASSRHRLEKLCRYLARPAIVTERLTRAPDGRILYSVERTWRDGSPHVVLDPQSLLERLVALVPRPRRSLVTYHGVLAPAASLRRFVVPELPADDASGCAHSSHSSEPAATAAPSSPKQPKRRRYSWAELLQRVFRPEVLVCPEYGGPRKILRFLVDSAE